MLHLKSRQVCTFQIFHLEIPSHEFCFWHNLKMNTTYSKSSISYSKQHSLTVSHSFNISKQCFQELLKSKHFLNCRIIPNYTNKGKPKNRKSVTGNSNTVCHTETDHISRLWIFHLSMLSVINFKMIRHLHFLSLTHTTCACRCPLPTLTGPVIGYQGLLFRSPAPQCLGKASATFRKVFTNSI